MPTFVVSDNYNAPPKNTTVISVQHCGPSAASAGTDSLQNETFNAQSSSPTAPFLEMIQDFSKLYLTYRRTKVAMHP